MRQSTMSKIVAEKLSRMVLGALYLQIAHINQRKSSEPLPLPMQKTQAGLQQERSKLIDTKAGNRFKTVQHLHITGRYDKARSI